MILLRQRAFGEVKRMNKAKNREWLADNKKGYSDRQITESRVGLAAKTGHFVTEEDALVNMKRKDIRWDDRRRQYRNPTIMSPINERAEYKFIAGDVGKESYKSLLEYWKEHPEERPTTKKKDIKKPKALKEAKAIKPKKSILSTVAKKTKSRRSPSWAEVVRKALK